MGKKRAATRFAQQFHTALQRKAVRDPLLQPFADALGDIQHGALGTSSRKPSAHGCLDHLPDLVAGATAEGPAFQEMLEAVVPLLTWRLPYDPAEIGSEVADGMISAEVIGTGGLWRRDDMFAGLFLIAPNVHYPLHDHLADELYFVVSGALTVQNGFNGQPRALRGGEYSVTPSGLPHALTSGDEAALIAFAWIGEVVCDVYWWEHQGDDVWRRTVPKRFTSIGRPSSAKS